MLCKFLLKKNVLHIKSHFHWLIGKNPQGDFCINPETPPIWISSAFIWHLDHWLDAEHTFITHTTKLNQGGIHTLYEYENSQLIGCYNMTHLAACNTDFLPRVLRLLGSSLIVSGSSFARFLGFFFGSLPFALSFPLASFTWLFVSASNKPTKNRFDG